MQSSMKFYQVPRSFCALFHTGSFSHLPPGQCPPAPPLTTPGSARCERRIQPTFPWPPPPWRTPSPTQAPDTKVTLRNRGVETASHACGCKGMPGPPGRPNLFQERSTLVHLQQVRRLTRGWGCSAGTTCKRLHLAVGRRKQTEAPAEVCVWGAGVQGHPGLLREPHAAGHSLPSPVWTRAEQPSANADQIPGSPGR